MAVTTFVRKQAAVMAVAVMLALLGAPSAAAAGPGAGPSWTHQDVHVCNPAGTDQAACTSIARVLYENGIPYQAATPAQLQAAARAAASISFTAVGIRTAYGITGQGDPSRVIAIVDAYDDPGAFSHLTTYRNSMLSPSQAPINNCSLSQLTGLTSSASTPCFTKVNQTGQASPLPSANSGWSNEIDLDLQAASAVCPMCSLLLLEANSSSFGNLGTAATTASNAPHVLAISNSFGTQGDVAESAYPAWNNAATTGIAVLAAAGDWGYGTSFPASSTNVIGVGGTTLAVSSTTGARTGETAWTSTGSGCSSYNLAPSWQVIPGSPCGSMKAVSDLSADADPYSGLQVYTTYSGKTGWYIFGGTSLATPIMSALYAMQGGYSSEPAGAYAWASSTPYYDVTSGSNGTCSPSIMCNAGTGWDGPTGLGSIATSIVVTNDFSISANPSSLSVAQGAQGTSTISTAPVSGSAETVALSITGLPNGVTAAFNPSSVTTGGSSTLTLTVGSSAATGTYTLTITGTATSATHSIPLSLTVTAPVTNDFSISASPSSLTVVQGGASATSAIGTTVTSGSAGTVALSASISPSNAGLAATLSPTSVTAGGGSTLTVTAVSSATIGLYTVTITGTEGLATHSAAVQVTVNPPATGFSLSASPSSLLIRRGQSTSTLISIIRTSFTASVSFTLGSLPRGVGGTFSPQSTTGNSSTLTITTSRSAHAGTYTLTITGQSGSLTYTTPVTLTLQ